MSEKEEEVVIELEETRGDKYEEWKKGLKSDERARTKRAFNLSLKSFPEEALKLQFLKDKEGKSKVSVIGMALRKYFEEMFNLPAQPIYEEELETVGDRLIKIIKETEKLLDIYEKHTGLSYSFSKALGHDWQEEKSNWKKYHDLITSAIKKLEIGVIPTSELHQVSSLDLFKVSGFELLTNRIKNIENEVTGKEDLEKLNNLASDVTGAIGFAEKIEKLIKKYREIEMEK